MQNTMSHVMGGDARRMFPDRSAAVQPRACDACGRALAPAGADWMGQWYDAMYRGAAPLAGQMMTEVMRTWDRMARGMFDSLTPPPMPGAHVANCGCARCRPDDCHCRCCVVNADLLVNARVGERRVVPLVIENNMRREREVSLELSSWTNRDDKGIQVAGLIEGPTKFTLKACEERVVTLIVNVSGAPTPGANENRMQDVTECQVVYADLRVVGCDIRPIRIAVSVLPRDCGPTRIDCRCGCC
ncbi:MAG: hypothetical protein ACKV2V_15235 [Blastocatellia bacterium]